MSAAVIAYQVPALLMVMLLWALAHRAAAEGRRLLAAGVGVLAMAGLCVAILADPHASGLGQALEDLAPGFVQDE